MVWFQIGFMIYFSEPPEKICSSIIDLSKTYVYDNITWDLRPTTPSSAFNPKAPESDKTNASSSSGHDEQMIPIFIPGFIRILLKDFHKYCSNVLVFIHTDAEVNVYGKFNRSICSEDFRHLNTWFYMEGMEKNW